MMGWKFTGPKILYEDKIFIFSLFNRMQLQVNPSLLFILISFFLLKSETDEQKHN